MENMTNAFPLKWPLGWERSESRKRSVFKVTMGKARDSIYKELKLMDATDIVVSSNIATYMKGGREVMYANQIRSIEDPGVAVYYTWRGEQYVVACDKWETVTENLQSIGKTINAIRGIERWGTGGMLKAAFQGFKQLPEQSSFTEPKWHDVLGVDPRASMEEIAKAYKKKAIEVHPDFGGDKEKFIILNKAYEQAKKLHSHNS
jgi:hypothetical protein